MAWLHGGWCDLLTSYDLLGRLRANRAPSQLAIDQRTACGSARVPGAGETDPVGDRDDLAGFAEVEEAERLGDELRLPTRFEDLRRSARAVASTSVQAGSA
jgi:hypothetical protein